MAVDLRRIERKLLKLALSYPEAWEDHPWGENVVKVGKKIFVFFGVPQKGRLMVGVKLPDANGFALTFPWAEPTGYGLGKAGWVSCEFTNTDDPPVGLLEDWIDESYRAVAPKKLIKQLDGVGQH
jgi:predicted DNA-binding protein (MmcQ/YjbR family)